MVRQDVLVFGHRGIVVVVDTDDENEALTYTARAGGRSVISVKWTGEAVLKRLIDAAHDRIDDAIRNRREGITERWALWMNDSTHWLADHPGVEPPVMLCTRGVLGVLEEVLGGLRSIPGPHGMQGRVAALDPALRAKAEELIERARREL